MEIRNLITFVHVAEMNSFTRAADTLGYSQSTVSFQIKQLETELGCLLFERINHTISLTDKGDQLRKQAVNVPRMMDGCIPLSSEEITILKNLLDKALMNMSS